MISSFVLTKKVSVSIVDVLRSLGTFVSVAHYADNFTGLLRLTSSFIDVGAPTKAWVYNLNTEAVSEYTNFNFNSMAVIGGVVFACDSSGLHQFGAATDNGAAIAASITLPTTDFGGSDREASVRKAAGPILVGGTSANPVAVTCSTEVGTYAYTSRSAPSVLANAITDIGKGLRGRYWTISVANTAGAALEIDSVDMYAASTTRRTGR